MRVDIAETLRIWHVNDTDGLAAAAVQNMGTLNVGGYRRIKGAVSTDVVGTLVVQQRLDPSQTTPDWEVTVPQDASVSPGGVLTFPFDELVCYPYVRVFWTQGGAPSTFFRARAEALQR